MKRIDLGNLPTNGDDKSRWDWVRGAFNKIALASRRDDDLLALTARVDALSSGGGTGDVVGPASAVDGTPTVFDGTTGKLLKNIAYPAFKALLVLVKGDVGLGSVDDTADVDKPVSAVQQTALDLKADIASPALTGIPTAPTQDEDDDSTAIATTEYVDRAIAAPILAADFTALWDGVLDGNQDDGDTPWGAVLAAAPDRGGSVFNFGG